MHHPLESGKLPHIAAKFVQRALLPALWDEHGFAVLSDEAGDVHCFGLGEGLVLQLERCHRILLIEPLVGVTAVEVLVAARIAMDLGYRV